MASGRRRSVRFKAEAAKAERDRLYKLRKDIVRRWAQPGPHGAAARCPGPGHKVVFTSEQRAKDCERQLATEVQALRQVPYECRHQPGHWHLTKWEWGRSL